MADRALVCGNCGLVNAAESNYCGRCGAFLKTSPGSDDTAWRPSDVAGEPRLRRQSTFIFTIALLFVVACVVLAAVVIVWRP
jgi:hypothetical protein